MSVDQDKKELIEDIEFFQGFASLVSRYSLALEDRARDCLNDEEKLDFSIPEELYLEWSAGLDDFVRILKAKEV